MALPNEELERTGREIVQTGRIDEHAVVAPVKTGGRAYGAISKMAQDWLDERGSPNVDVVIVRDGCAA